MSLIDYHPVYLQICDMEHYDGDLVALNALGAGAGWAADGPGLHGRDRRPVSVHRLQDHPGLRHPQ